MMMMWIAISLDPEETGSGIGPAITKNDQALAVMVLSD